MPRTLVGIGKGGALALMLSLLNMPGLATPASAAGAESEPGTPSYQAPEYRESLKAFLEMKAKAGGGTQHTATDIPDWRGLWRRQAGELYNSFDLDSGVNPELGPPYAKSSAVLTPKYKKAYDEAIATIKRGIEWDRLSYCLPAGMPRWLADPFLREFINTPGQTWMIYEQMQEVRRIYTDGRSHVPDSIAPPLWEGDSIGFWDGDTLVIHTTHMKAGLYSRGQPAFSFKVSTIERWRMTAPDHLQAEITVYDPESLQRPYSTVFNYEKISDPEVQVFSNYCEENNNAVRGSDGGTTFVLPGEPGYRDADTFGIPEVAIDSKQ